jgi:N-acylneuraminate cytidylyltransferase|tara:strand:+ start:2162 stop:2851 length:690 start_codon:yes stop_codon:yes gene_type:complete
MNVIVVIPARGDSKRIPRKNILPLGGKPLISYTIEDAKNARSVDRVFVSTDDNEIARVSRKYGSEIILRPPELATDTASTLSVLLHSLDYLKDIEFYIPDVVVLLQCTSPFRKEDDIDNAIHAFVDKKVDALFSAFHFTKYIWQVGKEGVESVNFDYSKDFWREQEFPPQYQANGSIFVYTPRVLREAIGLFAGKMAIYEMDYLNSIQVDTYEDFQLCEYILKLQHDNS